MNSLINEMPGPGRRREARAPAQPAPIHADRRKLVLGLEDAGQVLLGLGVTPEALAEAAECRPSATSKE